MRPSRKTSALSGGRRQRTGLSERKGLSLPQVLAVLCRDGFDQGRLRNVIERHERPPDPRPADPLPCSFPRPVSARPLYEIRHSVRRGWDHSHCGFVRRYHVKHLNALEDSPHNTLARAPPARARSSREHRPPPPRAPQPRAPASRARCAPQPYSPPPTPRKRGARAGAARRV